MSNECPLPWPSRVAVAAGITGRRRRCWNLKAAIASRVAQPRESKASGVEAVRRHLAGRKSNLPPTPTPTPFSLWWC